MQSKFINKNYNLLVIVTFIFLGTLIYSNTFFSSFQFDDKNSIINNSSIRNLANLSAIWNFWPNRFITYLSLAINYHFHKLNVFGYHLFNLIVHLLSAALVWRLSLLTFVAPLIKNDEISKHAKLLSFFIGLIFLVHPIQTQGVTYIIQRAASLGTLFYLFSLVLYVKSRQVQYNRNNSIIWMFYFVGSLMLTIMAFFSKEMTITLPFAILLYEFCFLKTGKDINRKQLVYYFLALSIIPFIMFVTKSADFIEMRRISEPIANIPPWHYLLTQFRVIVTYIRLLFAPLYQNVDYDYPIADNLFVLPTFVSLLFLITILIVVIRIFCRFRLISFGIFWFFVTILPESSIVPIKDVIFEHRLYLPMVGFSFFLASSLYYFLGRKSLKIMILILVLLVNWYSSLTYTRNFDWKDEFSLWDDTVRKSPRKARPNNNRGVTRASMDNFDQAISDFNTAIQIDPNYYEAYVHRGNAYASKGNFAKSFSDYEKRSQSAILTQKGRGVVSKTFPWSAS
ncbi:MAG: hypothetical protein A2Y00_08355 [Omnitrophica WOR_2 bacterium GWF2_43_52]